MDAQARHAAIVDVLRREARGGVVPFVRLVAAALYAPGLGYYVSDRPRVGKAAGTDFTTAAALGPMSALPANWVLTAPMTLPMSPGPLAPNEATMD